ncbi:MAG: ImmA/IrrE family metallo-endopeptidase [Bacteroidetes bacterium]|nr:ImmA/IrrE family metallo-endopeptidase [Bacteroidota bacterium]
MKNHFSTKEIDNLIFDILRSSKSFDVFPTPVDKIVEYCELNLSNKNEFHNIPSNYIPKKIDAFNRMLKKILGAFDREEKVIYIDPKLPTVKQTFVKLHETGHGVIPWQKEMNYQDDEYTLSPAVKETFEAEANYFASGSLFQLQRFEDEMRKLPLEIGSPMALAKKFGGSNHAAMRRYAEVSKKRCSLIVLEDKNKSGDRFSLDLRNIFHSPTFVKEFGELTIPEKLNMDFPFIADYSRKRQFHKEGAIQLITKNGSEEFSYHYFNNRYNVFVLIIPKGEKIKSKTKIYLTP